MLSIPEIVEDLKADFPARGITVEILYGSFNVEYYAKGRNRIVLGPGTYDFEAPGIPNAPGVQITNDDQTTAARSVCTILQNIDVWVQATPPDKTDTKRSENAQKATAALQNRTIAALYRILHGSLGLSQGEWPNPEEQEFLFGSVTKFVATVGIPVLDDEYVVLYPDPEVQITETIAVMPEGEITVALTPEP